MKIRFLCLQSVVIFQSFGSYSNKDRLKLIPPEMGANFELLKKEVKKVTHYLLGIVSNSFDITEGTGRLLEKL